MNCKLLSTFCIAMLLSSCLAHCMGMYLSPVNSITSTYHTIPFKSDSIKSAVYGSMLFSAGSANDNGWDWIKAGQTSIYRSHNLGKCQDYNGANLSLGNCYLTIFTIHIIARDSQLLLVVATSRSIYFITFPRTNIFLEVMVCRAALTA